MAGEQNPYRSSSSSSPRIEDTMTRDMEDYADDEGTVLTTDDEASQNLTVRPMSSYPGSNPHSLAGSYRRPSFFTTVSHATVVPHQVEGEGLTQWEREQAIEEERHLLSDNNVISENERHGKYGRRRKGTFRQGIDESNSERGPFPVRRPGMGDGEPTESTSLLGPSRGADVPHRMDDEEVDRKWEEAVIAGRIQTTWSREAMVIGKYSAPLMITFMLQYSLTVASIFTLGHLGKEELGGVSLASMTASITGYAVYQGLATSLDTLCAQAFGAGRKKMVGLQMQRMVYFLWTITIPIALVWFFADKILMKIVPEKEVAALAGLYLKVVLLGAPGYALFESGKRFVQAQGLFSASLYVLLFCAPLNIFLNWFLVWKLQWGFIGAPIAVAITDNLMPLCLFLYVYFVAGYECWNGFSTRALQNWSPMIRLALPGLLMVEAECLSFEILTLASSYLGTTPLAAQSVLGTISSITFQIPFPISIAGSTRLANLIGATLVGPAKTSAKVTMGGAVVVGLLNMVLLSALRSYIPRLFTSEQEVIDLVADVLPLCAAFQLFDALAANCNGILRGLGRQEIGGYVQLICYYVIAIPVSIGTTFGLGWGLFGLWSGVAIALFLVSVIEGIFITRANWNRSVEDAIHRNTFVI